MKINGLMGYMLAITKDELLSMLKQFPATCGVSAYDGVLILWDEDFDNRVLRVVDILESIGLTRTLVAVQEHKATLNFVWQDKIPDILPPDFFVEGDVFCVNDHAVIHSTDRGDVICGGA